MVARSVSRLRFSWRYLVPLSVAAVVAVVATGVLSAGASPSLPPRTAAQLLADVRSARVDGFAGTVVQKTALGLPALPGAAAEPDALSLLTLLAGNNTIKVWYAGPAKQRIALLSNTGEMDVFHNGADVWQWDSANRTATHLRAPMPAGKSASAFATLTPGQVAQRALAAIGPTTVVRVDTTSQVAGRPVYRLVLEPRDPATRIASVTIEIDGKHKVPLGAQIYARNDTSPAVDVSFTGIDFGTPDSANFSFTPPSGASVTTVTPPKPHPGSGESAAAAAVGQTVTTVGSGWTQVVVAHATPAAVASTSTQFTDMLTPVSGPWGSGKLLSSALGSLLVLPDGRVLAGAVDPQRLYAAVTS